MRSRELSIENRKWLFRDRLHLQISWKLFREWTVTKSHTPPYLKTPINVTEALECHGSGTSKRFSRFQIPWKILAISDILLNLGMTSHGKKNLYRNVKCGFVLNLTICTVPRNKLMLKKQKENLFRRLRYYLNPINISSGR